MNGRSTGPGMIFYINGPEVILDARSDLSSRDLDSIYNIPISSFTCRIPTFTCQKPIMLPERIQPRMAFEQFRACENHTRTPLYSLNFPHEHQQQQWYQHLLLPPDVGSRRIKTSSLPSNKNLDKNSNLRRNKSNTAFSTPGASLNIGKGSIINN